MSVKGSMDTMPEHNPTIEHRLNSAIAEIRQIVGRSTIEQGSRRIKAYSWWDIAGPVGNAMTAHGLRLHVESGEPVRSPDGKKVSVHVKLSVVGTCDRMVPLGAATGEMNSQFKPVGAITEAVRHILVMCMMLPDDSDSQDLRHSLEREPRRQQPKPEPEPVDVIAAKQQVLAAATDWVRTSGSDLDPKIVAKKSWEESGCAFADPLTHTEIQIAVMVAGQGGEPF